MAERFKRTYISAREFVNSWEKEIYELNNLDYFIFQIMNDLGTLIEQEFFKDMDRKESLYLNSEEVGNLVFNLGDSLQLFFEKNCFGNCSLSCPSQQNDALTASEQRIRQKIINEFDPQASECQTKDQCLYLDLMNYVVLDTLIDFYNYELNIVLDETDLNLLRFAEFVMDIIIDFINNKGQHLLALPAESAGDLFKDSLKNDETPWSEIVPDLEEEEDDESEIWKTGGSHISSILTEFREDASQRFDQRLLKPIDKFEEYLTDFLEVRNFEEVDTQDLEEFFLVILINELRDQDELAIEQIITMFNHLFNYIEFQYACEIKTLFDASGFRALPYKRTVQINREYQKENPLVDFLLSPENQHETQVEGFYEVVKKSDSFYKLRDIHLNSVFQPVDMSRLGLEKIRAGDIVHGQLNLESPGWSMCRLEMVYPPQSKPYLL